MPRPDWRLEVMKAYGPPIPETGREANQPASSEGDRVRVNTAAAVLAAVEDQVNAVCRDPDISPLARAQVVGRLAHVALQAIATRDLADRVEALEAALASRSEA